MQIVPEYCTKWKSTMLVSCKDSDALISELAMEM